MFKVPTQAIANSDMTNLEADKTQIAVARNIVDGRLCESPNLFPVTSPYDNSLTSYVANATPKMVKEAIRVAQAGANDMANMPGHERRRLLLVAADIVNERKDELAALICAETAKAIRDCNTELARALDVIRLSAEESIRIAGRHIPLEGSAVGQGRLACSALFPVGVVAGIVPFNAPVNLTCHKLAPGLAAGNSVVIKAPPQAPKTVEMLVRCFLDAGFPPKTIGLIHGEGDIGAVLVRDPRVDFLSFTGSAAGGLAVKQAAGTRGCILELGGIGPTIVHSDAEVDAAARAVAIAGFRLAGQSCASVQNLFVHTDIADEYSQKLVSLVEKLKFGDPSDPETDFGPVIDERSAERIEMSIKKAVQNGATLLTGGTRSGTLLAPTVLSGVQPEMNVAKHEIFGPVVALRRYEDISDPVDWISSTKQGINCGLFTDTNSVIQKVFRNTPVASIVVNGTSTFRPDQLPYGGTGNSGYGRESPADTVRAMCVERILVN